MTRRRKHNPPRVDELAWTVRALRSLAVCTQSELAAKSGVAETSICRYERGQKTPSPRSLERLSAAVGVPYVTVDEVLRPVLREVLAARAGMGAGESVSADATAWTDELIRALTRGPWGLDRPPSAADRQGAPELWEVLRDSSKDDRRLLLEETREYRSWSICELACDESMKVAPHSAAQAVEYAELAVEIALLSPGEDLFHRRLQGYAEAHLGNAVRVHGNPRAADEAFSRARDLWKAGAPGDPGLLNEARVLGLEASLRCNQRRFAEALDLVDQALAVDRDGETKNLLIIRGRTLEHLGDYDGAIAAFRQAAPLVDRKKEPRLLCVIRFNLVGNLCHLQRFGEAEALLPEVRGQAERLGQELDLVRTPWLEG